MQRIRLMRNPLAVAKHADALRFGILGVDTEAEAAQITELATENDLVLLEAIHWMFQPASQLTGRIIDSGEFGKIKSIKGEFAAPRLLSSFFFLENDVRFDYDLGGGCLMGLGYIHPLSALRCFSGSDRLRIANAEVFGLPHDTQRVHRGMKAVIDFPSSVLSEMYCDFGMSGWGSFGPFPRMVKAVSLEGGLVENGGFPTSHIMHSIKIRPKQGSTRMEHAYEHANSSGGISSSSCRNQLKAFVNKIRGREQQVLPPSLESAVQLNWVEEIYKVCEHW